MDDLSIAFALRCDERGLTLEQGIEAAEELAEEIRDAAQDRADNPATPRANDDRETT